MATVSKPKNRFVSFFGGLGYLSCLMQWMWTVAVFLPLLMKSDIKNLFIPDQATQTTHHVASLGGPPILWTIIGVIVTVIVVFISVVVLVRLPQKIAEGGEKVTYEAAEAIIPIVAHQKPLPEKRKKLLTVRLVKLLKLIVCLLPVMLLGFIYVTESPLPRDIVILVGTVLAIGSLVWFSLEYLLARLFKLPPEKII